MLIDTHCHLHDHEWFAPDQAKDALLDAASRDVKQVICIGTDHADSLVARDFALAHQNVYWTYGIHPEFADKYGDEELVMGFETMQSNGGLRKESHGGEGNFSRLCGATAKLERTSPVTTGAWSEQPRKDMPRPHDRPIAIGEVGLDYHYDSPSRSAQIHLFEQMLQLASDLKLPVTLHVREAFVDLWPILDNFPQTFGVVHSFTGSKRDLAEALRREFYIGVNGLATYTTTPLPPLEKMVLETDAPFLTPYHNRDTMNVPGNVREVAAFLSGKLGVAESIIEEQTTHNATQLFQLKFTGDGFFAPSEQTQ